MEYQAFVCYRLNPTQEEMEGDIPFNSDRNIHGRIFSDCVLRVEDKIAILTNSDDVIEAVLSLDHCYLIKRRD